MTKNLLNPQPAFASGLKRRHPSSIMNRTTASKTALLAVLANMTDLSVKELVQRYKLS